MKEGSGVETRIQQKLDGINREVFVLFYFWFSFFLKKIK